MASGGEPNSPIGGRGGVCADAEPAVTRLMNPAKMILPTDHARMTQPLANPPTTYSMEEEQRKPAAAGIGMPGPEHRGHQRRTDMAPGGNRPRPQARQRRRPLALRAFADA